VKTLPLMPVRPGRNMTMHRHAMAAVGDSHGQTPLLHPSQ
jgi:hypothetical protein